jgi:uncharacterized protein with NRDE domain
VCLVTIAINPSPDLAWVVIANRDEYFSRRTAPLSRWSDRSGIVAGADLEAGGTWMGVHPERGRIAMVTNVRDPRELGPKRDGEVSRGALVRDFLVGEHDAESFVRAATSLPARGFNLVAIDPSGSFWCSNRGGLPTHLTGPVHGASNALLDTPWPKVVRAKERLAAEVTRSALDEEALFEILADDQRPDDEMLPDTGVGLELERALSPARVEMPGYGTRSSTVLVVSRAGRCRIVERTVAPGPADEVAIETWFALAAPHAPRSGSAEHV